METNKHCKENSQTGHYFITVSVVFRIIGPGKLPTQLSHSNSLFQKQVPVFNV